ncbi:MAG: chromosomal replication initiator protein DnaA [Candidatus Omnitrophica bacterium]|nr:chromosomal replication initiator protein DnaA [Candidatus Omnitrophota bacterium]
MQDNLWIKILAIMREKVSPHIFETWFAPTKYVGQTESAINVEVPNKIYKQWLSEHYLTSLNQIASELNGKEINIDFSISPPIRHEAGTKRETLKEKKLVSLPKSGKLPLNPKYSFDNFVVGSSNRFAHAAALAVAESPARAYNPLFIYGRVGLGKTHLLQAIAFYRFNHKPDSNLVYISSERFTNQFINAIRNNTLTKFRQKYRYVDILLIDDIHFIANKESTQEEFFHTFNTLYDTHRQIILSSDRAPKEIPGLEERLISRFSWGLVVDIQPPDLETRIAILKKRLEKEPVNVPDEIVLFIAQKIKNNIRELEGALIRVIARASLTHQKIDLPMVEETLKDSIEEEKRNITPDMVQKVVAEYFKLHIDALKSKNRSKNVVYPRQIAMFLMRRLTNYSLKEIGAYFAGKDHTTILHSCNKIEEKIKRDKNTKLMIDNLIEEIRK